MKRCFKVTMGQANLFSDPGKRKINFYEVAYVMF
jgi:hypothetical protein